MHILRIPVIDSLSSFLLLHARFFLESLGFSLGFSFAQSHSDSP